MYFKTADVAGLRLFYREAGAPRGIPLRSSIRRNAKRLSPSRPCQPRLATSSRSPPMDFTGYQKIASTCPISMSMLDPSPPNRWAGLDNNASRRSCGMASIRCSRGLNQ
jgi:hypothetical protein